MGLTAIFTYAFAIFAMFFGSGNLVFPLEIGIQSGSHWFVGFIGLFLTGIFLPFLGLFVIKLHKGDYLSFFDGAGRFAKRFLPFFTLSLLGSFGVVPRCITVAHGGLSHIFPDLSLLAFSLIFCIITFLLCLKDSAMVNILGKWMSPLLVLSLTVLIIIAIWQSPAPIDGSELSSAFFGGFLTGYQTMDLFAAFFFSALIFQQIQAALPKGTSDREILKYAVIPSILGSLNLALIYLGFVYLGSHYSSLIIDTEPELMLPTIITAIMGSRATVIVGLAMVLSCLTTAIALNNIYARYLCRAFSLKDDKFIYLLFATTSLSFTLSLLDFRGIATMLAPILEISYPGLISLTIASILFPRKTKTKAYLFWGISSSMAVFTVFQVYH